MRATGPPGILYRILQPMKRARKLVQKMQGKRIVHLLHIGKTGGTAIQHALQQGRGLAGNRHGIYLHHHDFKLRDVPVGEGAVFFLRDPVSRFVSGFYSRQRQGQPRYYSPWTPEEREAFQHFSTPNQLASSLCSPDEREKARAQKVMRTMQHVRSSYWEWFESEEYFRSRLSDIFFIGFQETLAADFDALRCKLGLPDSVKLPDSDLHAHRTPRHLDKTLEDEAAENIRRWYEDDYRFLRLCKELVAQEASLSPDILRSLRLCA